MFCVLTIVGCSFSSWIGKFPTWNESTCWLLLDTSGKINSKIRLVFLSCKHNNTLSSTDDQQDNSLTWITSVTSGDDNWNGWELNEKSEFNVVSLSVVGKGGIGVDRNGFGGESNIYYQYKRTKVTLKYSIISFNSVGNE